MNPISMVNSLINYVRNTTMGKVILVIIVFLLFLLILLPLFNKLRRRRIKQKETREIMKDLLTWRHLAQLVKGGGGHEKAKQELSDNLVKINELLKQGLKRFAHQERSLYAEPWFVLIGEPRSGKSSLLETSGLELKPSVLEKDATEDGKNSLPVRLWSGANAVVCDISGRVFFDRWLDGSSAEWNYIIKQICRIRRKRPLDGIIITIPADALLTDDEDLTSHKAILMANELGSLLQNCGMFLPCYVVVTKLDMVNGFHEYAEFIQGNLRHQIFGFENTAKLYHEEKFDEFWRSLTQRLQSGAKQLIAENARKHAESPETRMDTAAKIWTFPDILSGMGPNIKTYLNALFGTDTYHRTGKTYFEGVYFTSAKDMFISLSPVMAALSGLPPDEFIIPNLSFDPRNASDVPGERSGQENPLMLLPSRQTALAQIIRQPGRRQSYFIRELFYRRIFRKSDHAVLTRKKALMLHLPHYMLCTAFVGAGLFWGLGAWFNGDNLKNNLLQNTSSYAYLDGLLEKGTPFASSLIKEDPSGRFLINTEPVAGESLSSRVQFFYNAIVSRDMTVPIPAGFGLARFLTDGISPAYRYGDKAFIVNQLHASMFRMPIVWNVGNKIIKNVDTLVLSSETKGVLSSFLELDEVTNAEFNRFFRSGRFKLDGMLTFLIPDVSNDTVDLLNQYKARYERDYSYSIDPDYLYSDDFTRAKEAALDSIISAWRRYAVYPDSLYGRITRLAAISDEIIANYAQINEVLRRVNAVVTLEQVRGIVAEWKNLTNRQNRLTSEGRGLFADVRKQLQDAHIPLGFDTILSTAGNIAAGVGISAARQAPDAYRDNLIHNYLFNDLVFEFAIRQYTAFFDADMAFVRQKLGSSNQEKLGQVIALQGEFGGRLATEVQNLRERVGRLQDNELLGDKVDETLNGPSLFAVVERVLDLSSGIALPSERTLYNAGFETSWEEGQGNIKAALDEYDAYTKDYLENKKLSTLIANARNMLLAQGYLNRYTIFTTTLNFLYTFEANIAGVIESQAGAESAISFSDNALERVLGIVSYNRSYDPLVVKKLLDNIMSFASLFTVSNPGEELPAFLRQVPPSIYKPEAFLNYLEKYIRYWGRYPDSVYAPGYNWAHYRNRLQTLKAFQVNTVLRLLYTKSMEALNNVDASIISEALNAEKDRYTAALNDKANIVSEFLSADAERMIAVWMKLPEEPLAAFRALQSIPEEELHETYLSVYTADPALAIGWWNSLVMDGIQVLSNEFKRETTAALMVRRELLKQYPLTTDAPVNNPLTLNNMRDISALLSSMGAGILEEEPDTIKRALHPVLFRGSASLWAQRIYRFAEAVADDAKPLTWAISQPPIDIQNTLPLNGRLLAANRFRYIEVKSGNNPAERFSTYMNQKLNLASGYPDEGNISLRFFKTSEDRTPQATVTLSNQWAIFNLYFNQDSVKGTDAEGALYTPVYVSADGVQYVYFVELAFNREIPQAKEWNTLRTSPDLVVQDGFVVGNRLQF